jgi:5-methylcytosine-specific restriction protein A
MRGDCIFVKMVSPVPEKPEFNKGAHYVRMELHNQFKGNRQKGISSPADEPFIFVFTGPSGERHGYVDEFQSDGTLLYYGVGRYGDMSMDHPNTALRDHRENDESVYVFEETNKDGVMSYIGEYQYQDHSWVQAPDENDEVRDAILFRLTPVSESIVGVPNQVEDLSDVQLFELAKENSQDRSESGSATLDPDNFTEVSERNERRSRAVKEFARRIADGVCQGCDEEAPFIDEQGNPFLEVHHLTRISDGGPDDPENVIALCPNCQRRVHNGRDGDEFNQSLIEKTEERNERLRRQA